MSSGQIHKKPRGNRWILAISLLAAAICLLIMGISIFLHFYQREINWCQMTYMYRYPEYIRIPMDKSTEKLYPNYNLFVYGEGTYSDQLRKSVFTGIPVLFIPGNAGSYRQVRSIASMALTKVETGQHSMSFNFFTIDCDEELSGLYGGFLWKQTDFAANCVKRILSLYKGQSKPPKSVIIIGHSMGGLIARAIFLLPKFTPEWITTIITLATPHVSPVIKLDWYLTEFYRLIDDYWSSQLASDQSHLHNVTLVSIGGGNRDFLVSSDLTRLSLLPYSEKQLGKMLKFPQFWVENLTPAITNIWASADHLCIVWCNQLMRVLTRCLFDLHEWYPNQPRVKQSRIVNLPAVAYADRRFQVFQYHLSGNHTGVKSIQSSLFKSETQLGSSRQIEYFNASQLQIYFTSRRPLPTVIYKKFVTEQMVDKTILLLSNQDSDAFVHRCNPDIGCGSLLPWQNSLVLPPDTKLFRLTITKAQVGETVAAVAFFHQHRRFLLYRLLDASQHEFEVDLDANWHYSATLMGDWTVANFTLLNFNRPYQAYRVELKPFQCNEGPTIDELITAVHYHNPADPTRDLFLSVRHPFNWSDSLLLSYAEETKVNPILSVYLNPACRYYVIDIRMDFKSALLQIVKANYHLYPMLIVYLILMQIVFVCSIPSKWATFHHFLLFESVAILLPIGTHFVSEEGEFCGVTTTVVTMLIFGVFFFGHLIVCLIEFLLLFASALIRSILGRISFKKSSADSTSNGDVKPQKQGENRSWKKFCHQLIMWLCPLMYFVLFQSIGYLTCSYVSLLAFLPYWLYVMAAEIECRQKDLRGFGQKFRQLLTPLRLESAVFHLYVWLLLLCSPTLIVWIKHMRFSPVLTSDPSIIPAVLSTGLALLPLPLRYLKYRFILLPPLALYVVVCGDQIVVLSAVISVAVGVVMNVVATLNLTIFSTDNNDLKRKSLGRKSKLN